jgi:hypothetical protein
MFWRSATLGGLVLLALGAALCSNGQETPADSRNSNERAGEEQTVDDREKVEIPLSEIWALDMPGTRDVHDLEPEAFGEQVKTLPPEERFRLLEDSVIWQICQSLKMTAEKRAGPGFVVSNLRPDLLKTVREVLTGEAKRSDSFPANSEITAVFFSRQSQSYVHIYQIERSGNEFEVRYRFVPREETEVTENIALIPLGILPSGSYQVKFVHGPMEEKYLKVGFEPITSAQAERIVSQSFTFEVQK